MIRAVDDLRRYRAALERAQECEEPAGGLCPECRTQARRALGKD